MSSRWYPSADQLKDPIATERSFRQLLDQHYHLQDQVNALTAKQSAPSAPATSGAPPGSGPADTMLLGLPVAPADPQSLANGATLKFNKKTGSFQFS